MHQAFIFYMQQPALPGRCILYATTWLLHICNDRVVAYSNDWVFAYRMQQPGRCILYATTRLLHKATTGFLHKINLVCCIKGNIRCLCNNPVVPICNNRVVAYDMQQPGRCIHAWGGVHIIPMMN